MEAAAAEALRTLLAADRLLEAARPVGLAALMLLLALKAGPAYPHELAASLRSPPGRVPQRLLRLAKEHRDPRTRASDARRSLLAIWEGPPVRERDRLTRVLRKTRDGPVTGVTGTGAPRLASFAGEKRRQ